MVTRWNLLRTARPALRTSYNYVVTAQPAGGSSSALQAQCSFSAMRAGDQLLVAFSLPKDSQGQKYTETFLNNQPAAPDGTVAAGAQLKGTIPYEVPTSEKSFTMTFNGDGLDPLATWDLSL